VNSIGHYEANVAMYSPSIRSRITYYISINAEINILHSMQTFASGIFILDMDINRKYGTIIIANTQNV